MLFFPGQIFKQERSVTGLLLHLKYFHIAGTSGRVTKPARIQKNIKGNTSMATTTTSLKLGIMMARHLDYTNMPRLCC